MLLQFHVVCGMCVCVCVSLGGCGPWGQLCVSLGGCGPWGQLCVSLGGCGPRGQLRVSLGGCGPRGLLRVSLGGCGPRGLLRVSLGGCGPRGLLRVTYLPTVPQWPGQSRKYRPCPGDVPVRAMSRNYTGYSQLPPVLKQFQFQPFFYCSPTTISTILDTILDSRRSCAVSIAIPAPPRIFTVCACASRYIGGRRGPCVKARQSALFCACVKRAKLSRKCV